MSNLFAISNLSEQSVIRCEPWCKPNVDYSRFANKEIFRKWCVDKSTNHIFYSAYEGLGSNIRISQNNPPVRMYGLVVDYDATFEGEPFIQIAKVVSNHLLPTRYSKTFSNHLRVVWLFEEPIFFYNIEVHNRFIERLTRELKLKKLFPGLDEPALKEYAKYYELGNSWVKVSDNVISKHVLSRWIEDASQKIQWAKPSEKIPIETLRAEGEKQFPGRWPGGWEYFDYGVRGVRFWEPDADALAVIIRESGCQCFTGDKPFLSWGEIFGNSFVQSFADSKIGLAIENIWFDSTNYWRKPKDTWQKFSKGDVENHLRTSKGLSFIRKNSPSEIDYAIEQIHNQQSVAEAFPFLYRKDGIVYYNGVRYLNISTIQPLKPVETEVQWGEGFPWLSQYFDSLFDPFEQKEFFLSWLSHFYKGALNKQLERGLALFLAGPVGVGKTFISNIIIGKLMGSRQDAANYLTGNDTFNSAIFSSAVWTVDDAVLSGWSAKEKFSQIIKRVIANDSFTYRAMYRAGFNMDWIGRVIITMNDDPESLQMLPQTEINILDKILLIKVKRHCFFGGGWPSEKQIDQELPYFAAYLRDYKIPPQCVGSSRFTIQPYQHPDLLEAARSTSSTASFEELLNQWQESYFKVKGRDFWEGTPTDLLRELLRDESIKPIVDKNYNSVNNLTIHLNKLIKFSQGGVQSIDHSGRRLFRITPNQTETYEKRNII